MVSKKKKRNHVLFLWPWLPVNIINSYGGHVAPCYSGNT